MVGSFYTAQPSPRALRVHYFLSRRFSRNPSWSVGRDAELGVRRGTLPRCLGSLAIIGLHVGLTAQKAQRGRLAGSRNHREQARRGGVEVRGQLGDLVTEPVQFRRKFLHQGATAQPAPDVCVVRGSASDYAAVHPARPALAAEVGQLGLPIARGPKAAAYARAGIADHWILNLGDRVLEVHRDPARPGPARRAWGHVAIDTLGADATITPLAALAAVRRVAAVT
jgi:Putative restriction endonuclease